MDRPFLQTPQWLLFQQHLGHQVWRIHDGFISASIIRHDVRLGQNYLCIPYGPELDLDQQDGGLRNQVWKFGRDLLALAHHEGSMFVRIEPMHDAAVELLIRNGLRLRPSRRHIQPRMTMVMDLAQTVEQMMDRMHHKHRYNVGLAERNGVTIDESRDVDSFWRMLRSTAEHDDFRTHGCLYYKKLLNFFSDPTESIRTKLYFSYHGGRPIAGAIILEHAHTAYYLHGAMNRERRALMAPHLLHWELLKRYRAARFRWYDFWGLDSSQWPGVTRFKLGFSGKVIEYPGAFDLITKPFWRWLYHFAPR